MRLAWLGVVFACLTCGCGQRSQPTAPAPPPKESATNHPEHDEAQDLLWRAVAAVHFEFPRLEGEGFAFELTSVVGEGITERLSKLESRGGAPGVCARAVLHLDNDNHGLALDALDAIEDSDDLADVRDAIWALTMYGDIQYPESERLPGVIETWEKLARKGVARARERLALAHLRLALARRADTRAASDHLARASSHFDASLSDHDSSAGLIHAARGYVMLLRDRKAEARAAFDEYSNHADTIDPYLAEGIRKQVAEWRAQVSGE